MSRQESTRELFQDEVGVALEEAAGKLRAEYGDPDIRLAIIDHRRVSQVVAPWDDVLDWDYALQRASRFHRSCFVGMSSGASSQIGALALIKVSKHRVTTSLLFLQKDDEGALLPGRAMAMMDVILKAVAAVFESRWIVIDTPISDLVSYYKSYGYATEERLDGRLLLTKAAESD
ncbi:hypothetical protein PPH41_03600 [Burkholderia gladioli]|nr:hypothetical protein [Burkholderia gladioli]